MITGANSTIANGPPITAAATTRARKPSALSPVLITIADIVVLLPVPILIRMVRLWGGSVSDLCHGDDGSAVIAEVVMHEIG
jgi:hypothetical protein